MSITVLNPGLMTTVQDQGRIGYQQFGVSVSGVMDPRSAALANILVGNDEKEAVLECTMMGPHLQFNQANCIAITGGDLMPTLDGKPIPNYTAVKVEAGQVLKFTMPKTGCRAFIAFAGGLDIPEVMGSRSTYMKAKIGGMEGRKLQKDDVIVIISNSGRNGVCVDMAQLAKDEGLVVVALTNLNHSKSMASRHPSGKKLYEFADIVLDNMGCVGDASVYFDELGRSVAPTSTSAGAAILNAVVTGTVEIMLADSVTPEVFSSSNVDGGDEVNEAFLKKYMGKIRSL